MSHTQLQEGVLAGATRGLQRIGTLNLQRQQLEQRQRQNEFSNIMDLAKQDPEAATKAFNQSFGQEFGEVQFMGSKGDFSTFSFFDPESGQRQSAILNRSTGEFEPVGGTQARTGGDNLDEILADVLRPPGEEVATTPPPEGVTPTPPVTPEQAPTAAPAVTPTGPPAGLPPLGDVGIGTEPAAPRAPLAEERVRVEITVGKDKGRPATVPLKDFDPRSMKRIQ